MNEAIDKTTDVDGKPWAKLSEVKPGNILVADGGFPCVKDGARLIVGRDEDGDLFVPCAEGPHLLDGQADDGETLIGLYPDDQGKCAGGVEIGARACPKCGATEDDKCQYETSN